MNIGIVGLGLIGGSMGLELCSLRHLNNGGASEPQEGATTDRIVLNGPGNFSIHRVLGVARREQTCQQAMAMGVVDEASVDLALMATADIVVICTPLAAMIPTLEQLKPHLAPATIVTDVGSVKQPIVDALSALWSNFVGAHPMAGTEAQGIEAAQLSLFKGRPFVITPTPETPLTAVAVVDQLAQWLGAIVYRCHPEDHDRAVAWISHLPVMVSASLVAACMGEADTSLVRLAQQLASSGFRDTSRVGGGNPELGVMMARYNRGALLSALSGYRDSLDHLMAMIEREDWPGLTQILVQTQADRVKFVQPPSAL